MKLASTGGAGTSQIAAKVYEVVDGEERYVASICSFDTYSPQFEFTPGAQIVVRVAAAGCNGHDINLKGTATVAFYERTSS